LGLALKAFFLVIDEAKIALPCDLTSLGKIILALNALASLLEATLALVSSVFDLAKLN